MSKIEVADFLNKEIAKAKDFFGKPNQEIYKVIEINNFECKGLEEVLNKDSKSEIECVQNWGEYLCSNFFYDLHKYDNNTERDLKICNYPCLYLIEIASIHTADDIRKKINNTDFFAGKRNFPKFYKQYDNNSKVLYIGKANAHVNWRLITHLGYLEKDWAHGLHLVHWAKEIELVLNFKIFRFEEEMRKYLSSFEKILADHYKPIIGKHK